MSVRFLVLVASCVAVTATTADDTYTTADPAAAIKKVLTMLQNLVQMMESEAQQDEAKFAHFSEWASGEMSTTNEKIGTLNTNIENLNAAIQELTARKAELTEATKKLKKDIDMEQGQLNAATDKRNSEASAFTSESTNFENAIAACSKAVKLLHAHYGDGTSTEKGKPAWMSLVSGYIKTAHVMQRKVGGHKVAALLQEKQPNFEAYEDSSGDALNIVDQVKVLADTFQEDYEDSKQEEAKLKAAFEELSSKKKVILNTLRTQFDEQQGMLNAVLQQKAESEGALQMNEESLVSEQAYLSSLKKQQEDVTSAFNSRKKDRDEESAAVKEAMEVLESYSFVQKSTTLLRGQKHTASAALALRVDRDDLARHASKAVAQRSLAVASAGKKSPTCLGCAKAAAFLRQEAKVLHSAVLSAAAATSMGSEAIDEVIDQLQGLIKRIDQEHKTEKEHKEWCEEETGMTTKKRDDHAYAIEDIKQVVAGLKELIDMKNTEIGQKEQDIDDEDTSFEERSELRSEEKSEFEEDLEDHVDAIQALNEAIEILANFYAKRNKSPTLLQRSGRSTSRQPGGGQVVGLMSGVRKEFEEGKSHLQKEEDEAVIEFDASKKMHVKTDNDLHHDKDVITVEEQTAEQNMEASESDLESNQDEKKAAEDYLNQLGRSCYPLLARFDERKKLRDEEKTAIKDAIKVLRQA